MLKLLLLFLLVSPQAKANFAEFFGSDAISMGLANQSDGQTNNPSNNYQIPALLADTKKNQFNITLSGVNHDFEAINNIVIKNNTNSSESALPQYGNADVDFKDFFHNNINFAFPNFIFKGTLGLSIYAPTGKLVESDTGDPFLPEYSMYRSRYRRLLSYLNYAFKLNSHWSTSLGTYIGIQTGADTGTRASLNGTGYGSSGYAKAEIKPSLGALFSLLYKGHGHLSFFSYQQEMKSNVGIIASGTTNEPNLPFQIEISSMSYYDPHIFRLGHIHQFKSFKLHTTLEYQIWDNYVPPIVKVKQLGGVVISSNDYEILKTKNTLNYKLGATIPLSDKIDMYAGGAYRNTPIEGDFSGAGNTIDTDAMIFSLGGLLKSTIYEIPIRLSSSFQLHKLKEQTVTKTPGQENGTAGLKLGAPGYKIGGQLYVLSVGIGMEY
jgi:long-subunit fatty acid transport protein